MLVTHDFKAAKEQSSGGNMRNHTVRPFSYFMINTFVLFFSSIAFATADGPDYLDVRNISTGDQLIIHLKPASSSEVIGEIPHNTTCLKNLGCRRNNSNWWCKIDYQGIVGWINGKFVKEGGDCPASFIPDMSTGSTSNHSEIFTQQLLDGKILYDQGTDGFVKLSFQKSNEQKFDGTITFTFLTSKDCRPGTIERLPYRIKEGKIIYYAHDGSKKRLTLQTITATSWIILEEEDIDGDDLQFSFGPAAKKTYEFLSNCE